VLKMLRQMPQPLKAFYLAAIAVFLLGMVTVAVLDREDGIQLVMVLFGLLMAMSELVMALDFRGNATEYSRQMKEYKPAGTDGWGDRLIMSVKGVRVLGGAVCLVGLFLAVAVPLLP